MDKSTLLNIKKNIKDKFDNQNDIKDFNDFVKTESYDIIKSSELFDEEYYISEHPQISQDPITHYLTIGVYKEYNPNKDFDSKYYLINNPDIIKSGINPFVHYILNGIHENRIIKRKDICHLEEKYKVSIIMPTFNRKNIISKAINSVLKQSFQNFELLIVDDGSSDGTDNFIKKEYNDYLDIEKIKYFKLNHNGVSFTRNFGLNESSGNFIAYLDSDNEWNNKFLEFMLKELDEHKESDCAYCQVKVSNTVKKTNYVLSKKFDRIELIIENFIDLNSFIHSKKLFEKYGGFDENLTRLVDWDLIIRFTKNNPPLFVEKVLVNYFISNELNNITTNEPLEENRIQIRQKNWKEHYGDCYGSILELFDEQYYINTYNIQLNEGIDPVVHYLYYGYVDGYNPSVNFDAKYYEINHPEIIKEKINPLIHYIKIGKDKNYKINQKDDYFEITNNNLLYLSNYSFENPPLVSIIILNRNGLKYLEDLFINFEHNTNYSNFEIIVVDNASDDGSVEFLNKLTNLPIKIIENKENVSFSKGNNDAVKQANGEYILFMNNDMEVTYGWLNEMMGTMLYNDNVGAVGAKLVFPFIYNEKTTKYSFTLQHAGDIFRKGNSPCGYKAFNQGKFLKNIFDSSVTSNKKCILVTGATLLTKKDIFSKLGGFDENFWYGYEDVDYNLRLYEHGYNTILASAALLFHKESATRKNIPVTNNHKYLCKKWGNFLHKKILEDKINRTYFITDEKLNIQFITNDAFYKNFILRNDLHELTEFFKNKGYNFKISVNKENNQTNDEDIVISFTSNYNIEKINNNLIKILILNYNYEKYSDFNYDAWDIIILDNEYNYNKINNENLNVSLYYLKDFSKLGEQIIHSLYDTILDY